MKTRDMLCIVLLSSWLKKKRMIIFFTTQPVVINWPCRVQKKYDKQYCMKQNPCYGIMFLILSFVEANNVHCLCFDCWKQHFQQFLKCGFYTSFSPSAYIVQSNSFWTEFISPYQNNLSSG